MKLDRLLILAALLSFCAAWGVYELGLGAAAPVRAHLRSGEVPVPTDDMRACFRQRGLALFADKDAQKGWHYCEAHFARYRVLDALTLRINAIFALSGIGLAALVGFAIAMKMQVPPAKVIRGPQLLKDRDAVRTIRKALLRECRLSGRGIALAPGLPLSRDRETRHFLIWGSVGAGKTQTMLHLILGALNRGDGVLVLDVKGDMTARLPGEPVLIAPQDARSVVWDAAKDCRTKQDARELAARLIPKSSDPMWSDAAREIFVACLVHLQATCGDGWSWRDLQETTTLSADKLLQIAKRHHPNAIRNLETPESKTTQSILSTFQSHMHVVATLADAWDENRNDRFSIVDWLHDPPPFRPVILQRDGRYPELSSAWMGGLFSLLSAAVGSPTLDESVSRRVWIFVDEFPQLPRLDQFSTLIDLGRSKGVITVIGAQDIAQLRETYGRNQGDSWMSMIGTQIVTRINLSQAAREISEIIGLQEIEQLAKTRTQTPNGTSTACRLERERRPVIAQSELATRLGPTRKGVKALVLGVGEDVFELTFPYVSIDARRPASVPAQWTKGACGERNSAPDVEAPPTAPNLARLPEDAARRIWTMRP